MSITVRDNHNINIAVLTLLSTCIRTKYPCLEYRLVCKVVSYLFCQIRVHFYTLFSDCKDTTIFLYDKKFL